MEFEKLKKYINDKYTLKDFECLYPPLQSNKTYFRNFGHENIINILKVQFSNTSYVSIITENSEISTELDCLENLVNKNNRKKILEKISNLQ